MAALLAQLDEEGLTGTLVDEVFTAYDEAGADVPVNPSTGALDEFTTVPPLARPAGPGTPSTRAGRGGRRGLDEDQD